MRTICKDRRQKSQQSAPGARGVISVSADVDKLLGPKSYEELEVLEKQIKRKLNSNEPIDVDYWEHLLQSLLVWKAKAKLRRVSQTIVSERLQGLRKQQEEEASLVREKLRVTFGGTYSVESLSYDPRIDPEPSLKLRPEDKTLESLQDEKFVENIVSTYD